MANRNYANGRRREYEAISYFEDRGYTAVRTAGSHGLFDVIAWNGEQHIHAQVKKDCKPSAEEFAQLRAATVPPNTFKVVMIYRKRQKVEILPVVSPERVKP